MDFIVFFSDCTSTTTGKCEGEAGSTGSDGTSGEAGESSWYSDIGGLSDLRGIVGGWIGETLDFLVSPLNLIADAIQYVADNVGSVLNSTWNTLSTGFSDLSGWLSDLGSDLLDGLSSLGSSLSKAIKDMSDWLLESLSDLWTAISDGFSDLSGWLSDLGSDIGGWLSDLGSKLSKSIKDMWDGLTKNLTDLWDSIKDIFNSLKEMLNYINPFSDKFILKVAFIPEDGYFDNKVKDLKADVMARFGFFKQIDDAMSAVTQAVQTQQFKGWQVKVPYTGKTLNIIDTQFINAFAPKFRYFTGGFFVVITLIYLIRRGSRVIGAGKGG